MIRRRSLAALLLSLIATAAPAETAGESGAETAGGQSQAEAIAEKQRPPGKPLTAAEAEASGPIAWMRAETDLALEFRDAGRISLAAGGVVAVDPLTYSSSSGLPFIPTPAGEARFVLALEAQGGRVSKAMLVFADAPVFCGEDVATIGVDTGLASFYDHEMVAALDRSWQMLGPGKDLYNDWFHALIGETWVVGEILPLPDGTLIPMASSGFGDGGYPVAVLKSGQGRVLALYADFMGRNDKGEWLLPEPCSAV